MKRNRLPIIMATFSVVLFAAVARNAPDDRRDGNWWRGLERSEKASYMIGFFDGMQLGKNFSVWGISDKDKTDSAVGKAVRSYDEYEQKYLSQVTNGQLVDGVDTFYSDYRNRLIMMDGAVWLVVNEIAGKPDAEMQKMIENWRKNANYP